MITDSHFPGVLPLSVIWSFLPSSVIILSEASNMILEETKWTINNFPGIFGGCGWKRD